jgi:hypothetical protein
MGLLLVKLRRNVGDITISMGGGGVGERVGGGGGVGEWKL